MRTRRRPGPHPRHRWSRPLALGVACTLVAALAACSDGGEQDVTVGLITKQETNPFWVAMKNDALDAADDHDVDLVTATGSSDVDVESQVEAIRRMTADGVDGILVAPTDSRALVPAIEEARAAGVIVIAVDTPTDPTSAVDAVFATDNRRAGALVGGYAREKVDQLGITPRVALLDLAPGIASGELRREGFLSGFGIEEGDPVISGSVDTEGDEDLARVGMRELLAEDPGINVVYTVNEPAALGAIAVMRDAGIDMAGVVVVSVDGGCAAMKSAVRPGDLDATAQQYPENMAAQGVRQIAEAVRGGDRPSGYLDTGVTLVTRYPMPGVASENVPFGVRNCWG
ncbi:substrate-binding domain-containing protein [Cellulomonas cellasea]|uniref:Sugar ABC transporter substrate-binding protein n=1 Tax=Cellulomonas cellasea TaxID=43670 RepID=A0A4Y3KXG3_9CELL|nr:substrate-binding domain-containing protein [Cellulomonas cellasea]GEA89089.1 sugar ABC transporter substrate-binding protein [Cellulomonas cellasea]